MERPPSHARPDRARLHLARRRIRTLSITPNPNPGPGPGASPNPHPEPEPEPESEPLTRPGASRAWTSLRSSTWARAACSRPLPKRSLRARRHTLRPNPNPDPKWGARGRGGVMPRDLRADADAVCGGTQARGAARRRRGGPRHRPATHGHGSAELGGADYRCKVYGGALHRAPTLHCLRRA